MALIHCDFFSETLQLSTSLCVILPDPPRDAGRVAAHPPAARSNSLRICRSAQFCTR